MNVNPMDSSSAMVGSWKKANNFKASISEVRKDPTVPRVMKITGESNMNMLVLKGGKSVLFFKLKLILGFTLIVAAAVSFGKTIPEIIAAGIDISRPYNRVFPRLA